MKATLVFLACLIAMSAASQRSLTKAQHMDVLAQIDAHPLGNVILAQLSLHMSSGSNGYVGELQALLNELVVALNNQQNEQNVYHASVRNTCDTQIPELTNKVAWHHSNATEARNKVQEYEGLLDSAEQTLDETLDQIDGVNNRIEEGQATRDEQNAGWAALDAQHSQGVNACSQVVNLLQNLQQGGSYIQLKGRISDSAKVLMEMTHLSGKFEAFTPLVASLAQISAQLPERAQEVVNDVVGLVNTLKAQILATQAADAAWEDAKEAAWQKELGHLNNQLLQLTNLRNALLAQIQTYETGIEEQTQRAQFNDNQAAQLQIQLDNLQDFCDAEQITYDTQTADRQAELNVLGQLQDYVANRLSTAEEYVLGAL